MARLFGIVGFILIVSGFYILVELDSKVGLLVLAIGGGFLGIITGWAQRYWDGDR